MIPRSPEAEALSAMVRRNQDTRTPHTVDRTPTETARERKQRLFVGAKVAAARRKQTAQGA